MTMAVSPLASNTPPVATIPPPAAAKSMSTLGGQTSIRQPVASSPKMGTELTEQLNEDVERKYIKGIISFSCPFLILPYLHVF